MPVAIAIDLEMIGHAWVHGKRLALGARAFPTRGKGRIRVGTEAVLRTNEISTDVLLSTKKPEATRVNETT